MSNKQYVMLHKVIFAKFACRNIWLVVISCFSILPAHAVSIGNETKQAITGLPINIEKCRLPAYKVTFDLLRGSSNVGEATRELTQVKNSGEVQLFSSLNASMAFMEFIQKERSTLNAYNKTGFYSSEYYQYTKKPFKKEIAHTQTINEKTVGEGNYSFDPLSVYDHLRELTCSGLRTNISLNVQEENEITQYDFEFRGEQTLQLPMGTAETVLYVRTRNTSTRETSIWFDKHQLFLPVKIQQTKDGDTQAVLLANSIHNSTVN